jgi:ferredoxin
MDNRFDPKRRKWLKTTAAAASSIALASALTSCRRPRTADRPQLTADPADIPWPDADAIVSALPEHIDCVGCKLCMPCPYGVDIPAMFSIYNQALDDGLIPTDAATLDTPDALDRASTFLNRALDTLGDLHIAHRCVCCGKCQKACPKKILIARNMRTIGNLIDLIREQQCL